MNALNHYNEKKGSLQKGEITCANAIRSKDTLEEARG